MRRSREDGSDRYQQHGWNLTLSEVLIGGKSFLGLNDAMCVCTGWSAPEQTVMDRSRALTGAFPPWWFVVVSTVWQNDPSRRRGPRRQRWQKFNCISTRVVSRQQVLDSASSFVSFRLGPNQAVFEWPSPDDEDILSKSWKRGFRKTVPF